MKKTAAKTKQKTDAYACQLLRQLDLRKTTLTLSDLVTSAHATATLKGWWDTEPNIPEKLALIHSELSEALEEYRNERMERHEVNGKPEGFAIELADAVIRIADLCGYLGIDLSLAITDKMAYNESRPFRHGGKKA